MTNYPSSFQADESFARQLDSEDPLAHFRDRFFIPESPDGSPMVYFCGHSLGLQPRSVRASIENELEAWARLGVEGHFKDDHPWYTYHEVLREPAARLVGARPDEVVFMNSLTVNLHLMMASFYRPNADRYAILIDQPTFPSDRYAVQSQVRWHGLDERDAVIAIQPGQADSLVSAEVFEQVLDSMGQHIALVLLNGVNFVTGQFYDIARLTGAAHRHGCVVGLDLAHAVGNVPLQLHDWDVDFAAWCSYKYLNSGPGAVGGCFVHEKHGRNIELPRLAGWWGNDPATRFQMSESFIPRPGADGWQLSNPPIMALAPVLASLAVFDEAGMPALRAKSMAMSSYLHFLLEQLPPGRFQVISPHQPDQRGCQLSLLIHDRPKEVLEFLTKHGVLCDFREPNVIRAAPVPLYNTFAEVYRFVEVLSQAG